MRQKKTVSFIIIMVLLFISACSNTSGNKDTVTDNQSGGEDSKPAEPVELTVFVDFTWFAVDSFQGPIPDEITKKTGVKLKIVRASDANELPVMIASGNLPDIIYTDRLGDRLSNSNISYAWDELIEQYAPDFEIPPIEIANNTVEDGHFYTILNAFATEDEWRGSDFALPSTGTRALAVREDIMKQLGNPSIDTLEDFEQVLGMVKQQFPEMTPLLLGESNDFIFEYFLRQFGYDVGVASKIFERDGRIQYALNHPAMLETYKLLNRFYRNGYITAENLTYSYEQFLQLINTGNVFAINRGASNPNIANIALKNIGHEGTYTMVNSKLSDDAVIINDGIGWAGTYITKSNKDPEKTIKFLQYMKSDEGQRLSAWGIPGEYWTMSEGGFPIYTPDKAEEMSADLSKYQQTHGINFWIFGMSAVTDGLRTYYGSNPETVTALLQAKEITQYKPEYYFIKPNAAFEDQMNIYTKLNDMVRNEQTKVILAASEEDAVKAFQNMVKIAEDIGMRELEEWMTSRYPAIMERYEN